MSSSVDLTYADFKRLVYRRIQLAAAVYIIKTTPKGKSAYTHAVEIQQRLRARWLSSSVPERSQQILSWQQDVLSSRLSSLLPPITGHCTEDDGGEKHGWSEVQVLLDCLKANSKSLANNADFVGSIIQLQALAEEHSAITGEQYARSIVKLQTASKQMALSTQSNERQISSSYDSGFKIPAECSDTSSHIPGTHAGSETPVTNVASSVLLYIINSCNADELLKKSVLGILSQLRMVLSQSETRWSVLSLEEIINQWAGSVYQQALGSLHAATSCHVLNSNFFAISRSVCFSFIQEIIVDLLGQKTTNEMSYFRNEHQTLMILKISEGTNLWFDALEFTFQHLMKHADSMKNKLLLQTSRCSNFQQKKAFILEKCCSFQEIEESFSLLELIRIYLMTASQNADLKRYKAVPGSSKQSSKQPTSGSIAGLWRKHYNVAAHSHTTASSVVDKTYQVKNDVRCWKQILDQFFGLILGIHPLIASIIYECIQLLSTFSF